MAHIPDYARLLPDGPSTVAALDAITHKYASRGKRVEIVGLDAHSSARYERHTGQLSGAH